MTENLTAGLKAEMTLTVTEFQLKYADLWLKQLFAFFLSLFCSSHIFFNYEEVTYEAGMSDKFITFSYIKTRPGVL